MPDPRCLDATRCQAESSLRLAHCSTHLRRLLLENVSRFAMCRLDLATDISTDQHAMWLMLIGEEVFQDKGPVLGSGNGKQVHNV